MYAPSGLAAKAGERMSKPARGRSRASRPWATLLPWRPASEAVAESYAAAAERPSDPEGHTRPAPSVAQDDDVTVAQTDPAAEQAASGLTVALLWLAIAG